MFLSALVMFVIVGSGDLARMDQWDHLLDLATFATAVGCGVWLFGLVIMAVVFRGKVRMGYILTDKGLRCETIDRRSLVGNRMAVTVGILAGSPQAVGAGLIAQSQETMEVRWTGAFRAKYDNKRWTIALTNEWRTLMLVQCNADNYAEVSAAVERNLSLNKTAERVKKHSPVPIYLWRSLLVVFGTLPLFSLADEFNTGQFLPILILCFGLATVWMINLFGWVVMAVLVVQAFLVIADMLTEHVSQFSRNQTYYGFEVLEPDDFSLLLIAAVGAGVLVWLSITAVRGRWLAALLDGYKDMG